MRRHEETKGRQKRQRRQTETNRVGSILVRLVATMAIVAVSWSCFEEEKVSVLLPWWDWYLFQKTSGFSTSRPRTKGNINYAQIMDTTNRPVSLQAHFKLAPNDIFELRQPLVEVKNLLRRNVIAPMKNPTPLQICHDNGSSWTCPPFKPQRIIGWGQGNKVLYQKLYHPIAKMIFFHWQVIKDRYCGFCTICFNEHTFFQTLYEQAHCLHQGW